MIAVFDGKVAITVSTMVFYILLYFNNTLDLSWLYHTNEAQLIFFIRTLNTRFLLAEQNVWLCMPMYDIMAICDFLWIILTFYDPVWACSKLCYFGWMILCNLLLHCMTSDYVWVCKILSDSLWLCMTLPAAARSLN